MLTFPNQNRNYLTPLESDFKTNGMDPQEIVRVATKTYSRLPGRSVSLSTPTKQNQLLLNNSVLISEVEVTTMRVSGKMIFIPIPSNIEDQISLSQPGLINRKT